MVMGGGKAYPKSFPEGKDLRYDEKNNPPFHTNGGFVIP